MYCCQVLAKKEGQRDQKKAGGGKVGYYSHDFLPPYFKTHSAWRWFYILLCGNLTI
jgi:hypothetical protein